MQSKRRIFAKIALILDRIKDTNLFKNLVDWIPWFRNHLHSKKMSTKLWIMINKSKQKAYRP